MEEKRFTNSDLGYEIRLGEFASQANGSVWIKKGGTVVLVTVTKEKSEEFPGFFPLSVDYRELYSAAGRIPGGYFKREGKLTDKEVLQGRIIDRSLRPLFSYNYFDKVSVVATVYSFDKENLPTELALFGSSLAVSLAKIPFFGPAAGLEISKINGKWITSPSYDEIEKAEATLFVSGTKDGINMVEGSSTGITEEDMVEGMFIAHEKIKKSSDFQNKILKEYSFDEVKNEDIFNIDFWKTKANEFLREEKVNEVFVADKVKRENALKNLWENFKEINFNNEEKISESIVKYAFDAILKEKLTEEIVNKKSRIDGRDFYTVRPIKIETALLPKCHGSAIFKRGRTQLLVSTTLGSADDEMYIDGLVGEIKTAFMLHYNFLPFSVGEAKPLRAPGKREVGHGFLAANSIKAVLPGKKDFPYTIRILADVIESDGSSSMATVCGTTMSLMDAGVPIKDMVGGIAMGMLQGKDGKFEIITDIAGIEDEFGLMDFKVAGTEKFVTAVQMDIKYKGGLEKAIFEKALKQAKEARLGILSIMKSTMSAPRSKLSDSVPRFEVFRIPKEKIGAVIGSGGKVIKEITEKTSTSINIEDDGTVKVFGTPGQGFEKAVSWVKVISGDVKIGAEYDSIVRKQVEFGYFVELFPGFDGLVHVSTLPKDELTGQKKVYFEGDKIKVVVLDYDSVTNRIRLKIVG